MAKLDHVGIAVKDIEARIGFYRDLLGLAEAGREDVPGQGGLKIAFLQAGESRVELLQPVGPDSAVAKFIDRRGEGIQHIAFTVDDIEAALAEAKAAGYDPIDEKPRVGGGGAKIAFLHPKTTGGVLIEFCEHH